MSSAEDFINKFNDIKTLPHVVTRLSQMIGDSEATMKDFEDVIKMDPTLVVRLLRLVNSPFYGLTQKVDSISRAVAFIGMKNLHNMAVTDALKNIFKEEESSAVFSRNRLWLHCAAVSICSKMLGRTRFRNQRRRCLPMRNTSRFRAHSRGAGRRRGFHQGLRDMYSE